MGVWEQLTSFGGLPVHNLELPREPMPEVWPGPGEPPHEWLKLQNLRRVIDAHTEVPELPAADAVAWRLFTASWVNECDFADVFRYFLDTVDTRGVTALIVGDWGVSDDNTSAADVVGMLCGAADRLPNLRHLFFGDIVSMEWEISWIVQTDVSPLLTAFPRLEELSARGGRGTMRFSPVAHSALKSLRLETGGLNAAATQGVAASDLPGLEHLELWLGVEEYGGSTTLRDLQPFLTGESLPALRSLGLMNSDRQDEIAAAVAAAPVVARLDSLDLSMGVLGYEGGEALLTGQPLTHLKRLNLRHHFMDDSMMERFVRFFGDRVDVSGEVDPFDWAEEDGIDGRYTQVSE